MSGNKNYNGPIIARVFLNTFECHNKLDLKSWEKIAYLPIFPEIDKKFSKTVELTKLKYPNSCESDTLDKCEYLIMKYVIENEYRMSQIVKSLCIKPKIPLEVKITVEDEIDQPEPEQEITISKLLAERSRNLSIFIKQSLADLKTQLMPISKLYERSVEIHYLRYDQKANESGLYLFIKEYEDLTKFNSLLGPIQSDGHTATFLVDLENFKAQEEVNLSVVNSGNKDMHGLDLSWKISDKDELWLIENGTKIYEDKTQALSDFENNVASEVYVYYYRPDQDYDGWGLHLVSNETQEAFTDTKMPLAGKIVENSLRFKISSQLIGTVKDLKLTLLNSDSSKDLNRSFSWKLKKNASYKITHKKAEVYSETFYP